MRLKISKTNTSTNYYIIKDVNKNGKRSTMIYERLGTEQEIVERAKGEDISIWIKNYIKDLNEKIKEDSLPVLIKKLPNSLITTYCSN